VVETDESSGLTTGNQKASYHFSSGWPWSWARTGWPAWPALVLVAGTAATLYASLFHGRGLDVPDEGLLLHVAERLANGEVPYRDVYFIYTPGFQYLLALAFKVWGPSLEVERALLFAVHVALVVSIYALAARLTPRPLAMAAALTVALTGVAPYRTLAALVTVAGLVRYAETGGRRWLWVTGVLIGASYLVGQEIGIYALAATLGFLGLRWLAQPRRLARLPAAAGQMGAAVVVGGAVVGAWVGTVAAQGALGAMLDDTLRVTFLHQPRYMHAPLPPLLPLIPDDLSGQVVWGPPPYLTYVKVLLYLPILTAAVAAALLGGRLLSGRADLYDLRALPVALLAGAMLGTLAFRADYYHLRQIFPVTVVLLAWLLGEATRQPEGRDALVPAPASPPAGGSPAAAEAAVARDAGRTEGAAGRRLLSAAALLPLLAIAAVSLGEAWQQRGWLSSPLVTARGTVLVDDRTADDLGGLLRDLRERTAPGEAIFVVPAETAVYFLADRRNPTQFGQLVSTELAILREDDGRRQRELIAAIRAADVRWVVSAPTDNVNGYAFADYAPLVARYIAAEYVPQANYGYWSLLRRRP
jgi:hypothetical protein